MQLHKMQYWQLNETIMVRWTFMQHETRTFMHFLVAKRPVLLTYYLPAKPSSCVVGVRKSRITKGQKDVIKVIAKFTFSIWFVRVEKSPSRNSTEVMSMKRACSTLVGALIGGIASTENGSMQYISRCFDWRHHKYRKRKQNLVCVLSTVCLMPHLLCLF